MKVTIKEQELDLHYSMRIYIIYESMTDKSISPEDFNKMTNVITLLYATIIATLQYNRLTASLDWNDYIDWLDEQGDKLLVDFTDWFVKEVESQKSAEPIKEPKKGAGKTKKK